MVYFNYDISLLRLLFILVSDILSQDSPGSEVRTSSLLLECRNGGGG
jgi:hypothetical protein